MACSPTTLSLATIISIFSVILLAISFSTDNWISYEVKRTSIMVNIVMKKVHLKNKMSQSVGECKTNVE